MPFELASRHVEVARALGAAGQQNGVEFVAQIFHRNVPANVRPGLETHAFRGHLFEPPVKDALLQFEVRNAVAQQAADAVGLFEHGHPMSRAVQLLRGGQARGSRADHGHALAGAAGGRFGMNPALFAGVLDDGLLDILDGYRRAVDTQNAGSFAGRRADAPGEFGKIVGGVEDANGFFPAIAINEVIPIRDDVVERAAGVAEGHAAIHAARRLRAQFLLREWLVDLEEIVDALRDGAARGHLARVLHESGDLTHGSPARALRLLPAMRREHGLARNARNAQHALVLVREHLDELRQHGLPVIQNPLGLRAVRSAPHGERSGVARGSISFGST